MNNGGELGMLLTQQNGGTRLSSTRYVHYGTITARRESKISSLSGPLPPILMALLLSQLKPAAGVVS
jgi:hypothetical protein